MYRHILIPTDGSELAEHGVTNGLSLHDRLVGYLPRYAPYAARAPWLMNCWYVAAWDHEVSSERPFGRVVRGLDALLLGEGPQGVPPGLQAFAQPRRLSANAAGVDQGAAAALRQGDREHDQNAG